MSEFDKLLEEYKNNKELKIIPPELNYFFRRSCEKGELEFGKYLWQFGQTSIDLNADDDIAFRWSCKNGHLSVARWLWQLGEESSQTQIGVHDSFWQLEESNQAPIDLHAFNDYAFWWSCKNGHLSVAQWLWQLGKESSQTPINLHGDNDDIFRDSCGNGQLSVVQWLWQLGDESGQTPIDLHSDYDVAFCWSCNNDHLSVAKWLWQLGEESGQGPIGLHAADDEAFWGSCANGHLAVAQWLWQLGEESSQGPINLHAENDSAFHLSCSNGHLSVAEWLCTLTPYYIILGNSKRPIEFKIVGWWNRPEITFGEVCQKLKVIEVFDKHIFNDSCPICSDESKLVVLGCGHLICYRCLLEYKYEQARDDCIVCRERVNGIYLKPT